MNPIKPNRPQADPADQWVHSRTVAAPREPTVRMTFNLNSRTHKAFKLAALQRDVDMTDVLREFIDRYLAETGKLP